MKCGLQAIEMDISKQLHAYEVEYHVLQDELSDAPPPSEESDRLDKLEKANAQLKKQNMDLLEKLQVCRCIILSQNSRSREVFCAFIASVWQHSTKDKQPETQDLYRYASSFTTKEY